MRDASLHASVLLNQMGLMNVVLGVFGVSHHRRESFRSSGCPKNPFPAHRVKRSVTQTAKLHVRDGNMTIQVFCNTVEPPVVYLSLQDACARYGVRVQQDHTLRVVSPLNNASVLDNQTSQLACRSFCRVNGNAFPPEL